MRDIKALQRSRAGRDLCARLGTPKGQDPYRGALLPSATEDRLGTSIIPELQWGLRAPVPPGSGMDQGGNWCKAELLRTRLDTERKRAHTKLQCPQRASRSCRMASLFSVIRTIARVDGRGGKRANLLGQLPCASQFQSWLGQGQARPPTAGGASFLSSPPTPPEFLAL